MADATTNPAPAYSHTGCLGLRAYDSFNAHWHGDGPSRPKKRHALNADPARPDGRHFVALCGERVAVGDGRDFHDAGHQSATSVSPVGPGEALGRWVSCKRCRRKLGLPTRKGGR